MSTTAKSSVAPLVGYKITNTARTKRYGIGANSFAMFKIKAAAKFKLDECRVYLAADGSEVDEEEYFASLEPQTLFIVAAKDERVKTDFELLLENIRRLNSDVLQAGDLIHAFLDDNRDAVVDLIAAAQREYSEKVAASRREEHLEWFQGADERSTTKEEAMAKRSQDRIRGYFYKAKEEMTKSELYRTNRRAKALFDDILELFKHFLIGVDYFSCIFDRSCTTRHHSVDDEVDANVVSKRLRLALKDFIGEHDQFRRLSVSLCNKRGDFRCQGLWYEPHCRYASHQINPYASRENLVLFQIWNLDHQIEISRTVLPSLMRNVARLATGEAICPIHKRPAKHVSVVTYFLELFTLDNLRLVHIICHDKSVHESKASAGRLVCERCDEFRFLQQLKNALRKA